MHCNLDLVRVAMLFYLHSNIYSIMKNILFAAALLALFGCGGHSHKNDAHEHEHPVLNATKYSSSIELFVQYDELVAGHKASVVAYVTELPSFKPFDGGAIGVALKAGENNIAITVEPQSKGVYGFTLSPTEAAVGNLVFTIDDREYPIHVHVECGHDHEEGHAHSHGDAHNHGEAHKELSHGESGHTAHAGHAHNHDAAAHSHENNISFSKEQSWKIDFATAPAATSTFAGAVKVAAQVTATPDNFTTLVASASGKVQFAGNVVAGKAVRAGEPLFVLLGGNVTDNDAAVKFAAAESNYSVAKSDFERKAALYKENIVSRRDYEAAEAAYKQAAAVYESMKRSYSAGEVSIKSSIGGYVASLLVANGDYVQAGTPLAVIQRDGDMNISAELPVRYAQMLKNVATINVELPGGKAYAMDEIGARLTAVGSSVNNCAMVPVTVTARHTGDVLAGSIVTLHLAAEGDIPHVVVPGTALVEEMGNFFVFVQHTPVSFEKREVEVGATDGVHVQLLKGVKAGERVVTKGGVSLKLSQGAAALDPHAGHVH